MRNNKTIRQKPQNSVGNQNVKFSDDDVEYLSITVLDPNNILAPGKYGCGITKKEKI